MRGPASVSSHLESASNIVNFWNAGIENPQKMLLYSRRKRYSSLLNWRVGNWESSPWVQQAKVCTAGQGHTTSTIHHLSWSAHGNSVPSQSFPAATASDLDLRQGHWLHAALRGTCNRPVSWVSAQWESAPFSSCGWLSDEYPWMVGSFVGRGFGGKGVTWRTVQQFEPNKYPNPWFCGRIQTYVSKQDNIWENHVPDDYAPQSNKDIPQTKFKSHHSSDVATWGHCNLSKIVCERVVCVYYIYIYVYIYMVSLPMVYLQRPIHVNMVIYILYTYIGVIFMCITIKSARAEGAEAW